MQQGADSAARQIQKLDMDERPHDLCEKAGSRMPPREPVDMDEVMRYPEKLDAELQQVRASRSQAEAAADLIRLAVGFAIARYLL